MSFDLAVWDGAAPSTHQEAARVFEGLYREYLDTEHLTPPTKAITALLTDLLARWPDAHATGGEPSPWSWGPMTRNASGPILYFGVAESSPALPDVRACVDRLADRHGLVCYDPQLERVTVPDGVEPAPGTAVGAAPPATGEGSRRSLLTRFRRP
jgi:hypothetical protein